MTAGQIAALIAAVAFALLSVLGGYVLLRLARLISEAAALMTELRTRSDALLERANSAVDRAHEQLTRTDAIGANLDEINSNLAELTGDISVLTRAVRAMLAGPAGKVAAFAYGVRRAIWLRRTDSRRLPADQRVGSRRRQLTEQEQRAALSAGR